MLSSITRMASPPYLIYNSRLSRWMDAEAFVLYPFIFFAHNEEDAWPSLYKHELTHVQQVEREGFIPFYFKYLINHLKFGYSSNPYEVEAYSNQKNALTEDDLRRLQLPTEFSKTDRSYHCRKSLMKRKNSKKVNVNKAKKTVVKKSLSRPKKHTSL
jgi:hypothetical protein